MNNRRSDDSEFRKRQESRDFPLLCYVVASLALLVLLLVETLP